MIYQHKTEKAVVTLLPKTATNKYGNKLLWIRLENGNTVSMFESKFKEEFKKVS